MTTFRPKTRICAICGTSIKVSVLTSTNAFGSPDLDLRPPEMKRSTMDLWVQECPVCGYVSHDLEDKTTVTRDFLKTPEYRDCSGIIFKSKLASRFYRHHLICLYEKENRAAFNAILYAAWACDDAEDVKNAVLCRRLAVSLATRILDQSAERDETLELMRADLLRRAGLFDELKSLYSSVTYPEELLNQILRFELALAEKGDTACYTVSDAQDYSGE